MVEGEHTENYDLCRCTLDRRTPLGVHRRSKQADGLELDNENAFLDLLHHRAIDVQQLLLYI